LTSVIKFKRLEKRFPGMDDEPQWTRMIKNSAASGPSFNC